MGQTRCFKCGVRESVGFSAFCERCQPLPCAGPQGEQCGCDDCGLIFATLTDFEQHQWKYQKDHPKYGLPTGICYEPQEIGLEARNGVWGTPEGNANRTRKAKALASRARASRRALPA